MPDGEYRRRLAAQVVSAVAATARLGNLTIEAIVHRIYQDGRDGATGIETR